MTWKYNPFTNNLDYYETGTGGDPATTVEIIHVANFSALPNPTTVGLYDIYIVDAAQGTKWLPGSVGGNYYPAGAYYSNLVSWVYSESAGQATQAEVNTGTVTDKFVTPDTLNNYSGWTKSKVGLSNVDNTTDADKPISIATQNALNLIVDINWLGDYNNGYTYTVGDGVLFNGASFRMYNAIGAAGYTPSAYPGNWKQITEYISAGDIGLGNVDNTSDINKPISTATQTALNLKADLVGGTVPSSQLPSYVDDVIEGYYSVGIFYSDAGLTTAIVPTTGKIYVDLLQNKSYRWSGSVYISISNPISSIDELTDVTITSVTNGQILQYNLTTSQWENKTITLGNGDMQKSVYDIDNDGIVDYSETIAITARNPSVSTVLRKGTIVYLNGSTGNRPNAYKARANAESTSAGTFGVVVSDIGTNSDGLVAALGTLHDLDTRNTATYPFTVDTLLDGDALWLDPNNDGYVTKTKPQAPNHIVSIGIVARTTPNLGRIIYRISNGFELDELHNVFINGTLANNDILYYDAATSLWKTKQLTKSDVGLSAVPNIDTTNPANISQSASYRFVTDIEKGVWNGKQDALGFTPVPDTITVNGHLLTANVTVSQSDVGLSNVDNTSDANKPVSTAQSTAIGLKENTITGGTTSQYWRGDKSFQTLDKTAIGLSNVDNTSDAGKPISTATQTAINLKLDTNSSINALNDVTITSPIVNQLLQWNGSQWINASSSTVNAGPGVVYFLTNTTAGFGTYEYMSKTPDALAEVEETVVVNANTVLIHEYISDVTINKTLIDAGIWEFNLFGYVNALDASFVVNTYKRTSGGVETLLFTTETELINWTTVDLSSATTVQPQYSCNATDILVIKIYGKTTQTSNITLKLVHSGTNHYSHLHTPLTLAHNDIAGLQGGAAGEYYHLNASVNTALLSWNTSGVPDAKIQSATTWNAKVGGSGTTNYLPKFTAGSTIGNSQIQDNAQGVGIGIAPLLNYRLNVYGALNVYSSLRVGLTTLGDAASVGAEIRGIDKGIITQTQSDSGGIGVTAVTATDGGETQTGDYIGGFFSSSGGNGGVAYSVKLQDGTEGFGKFLKSVAEDGRANWASIVAADVTGVELLANKDIDGTLTANSDTKYPSQKAIKTYVDAAIAGAGAATTNYGLIYAISTGNYTL